MTRLLCILGFLCSSFFITAQTTDAFTESEFLWYVEQFHPVSKQGRLLTVRGDAAVRRARGGFDPYIHADVDQKFFEDKSYFRIFNGGLKVPTWYGIELKTGLDQNSGVFLNPEASVPPGGLWYGGISVPIGKGLFIDDRRAALRQAQLFAESTIAERQNLMNDLYFDAIQQYWKWMEAYNQFQVFSIAVDLAQTRFEAVKGSYRFGDVPAIDTLESFIQLQNRTMLRNEADLAYQNATLKLSNFLWFENNTPLEITDALKPPSFIEYRIARPMNVDSLFDIIGTIDVSHPEMILYAYKLAALDIDRRMKIEKLKPKLNVNYNLLNEPVGNNVISELSPENYKWGLEFSFPLLLRSERGDLELTKVKILETELDQQQKLLELQNKVRSFFNAQLNLEQQVQLYDRAVVNYERLLSAERQKFSAGESSLFIINSRELKLLEAQVKLIELQVKYSISQAGIQYAAGVLFDGQ